MPEKTKTWKQVGEELYEKMDKRISLYETTLEKEFPATTFTIKIYSGFTAWWMPVIENDEIVYKDFGITGHGAMKFYGNTKTADEVKIMPMKGDEEC